MKLCFAFTIAALLPLSASVTHAQDADPVLVHFREFRAALDRGDAAAAETAAEAALAASEAVNGPRTAVLALNLAMLRLDMGEPNAAYAPAQRAHSLATADENSGVDPLLADLVLGRSALAVEGARGASALLDALAQAERRGEFQAEAYSAAVDLARTAFSSGEYETAREAWTASSRLAAGSPSEPEFARGLARTGEGAAIFMQAIVDGERERRADGAPAPIIARRVAREAGEAFAAALGLLRAYAENASPDVLTTAQSVYAEALAWQEVLRARMQAQGEELPRAESATANGGAAGHCAVRLVAAPPVVYSFDALGGAGVAAVVLRVTTDAQGGILDRKIVAAAPAGAFIEAVAAVADELRVEIAPEATPGCRRDGTQYAPIVFVTESGLVTTSLGSLALWRATGAQEPPTAGATEEVTVLGTRPDALRAEIERAEDAVFARFNEINSSDDFDIGCTPEIRTGTRIPQRVCAPAFLRDAQTAAGRDTVLSFQGSAISGSEQEQTATASDRALRLDQELRRLAQEDERLLAAMRRLVELRGLERRVSEADAASRGNRRDRP